MAAVDAIPSCLQAGRTAQIRRRVTPTADIFATGANTSARLERLGGEIPVLMVDDIFADPLAVREMALSLPYEPAGAYYPGRKARVPQGNGSLGNFLRKVVGLVTREYLPVLPRFPDGLRYTTPCGAESDFAITDLRPNELSKEQSRPHIDQVPVFGLVYLNEQDRGGTLFFRPRSQAGTPTPRSGYQVESDEFVDVYGRIEGRFNRLAIYPGFILHSGEIKGDWISNGERLRAPRLTQRIMFYF